FERDDAPPWLVERLEGAGALARSNGRLKSTVRVSRLRGRLYLHSAFPTDDEDAVFFGPDSYRYADLLAREIRPGETGRIVDVGGGAGVGAIVAADLAPQAQLTLTDVNRQALRLARINAAHAGKPIELVETAGLDAVEGPLDLVIANPPYMADSEQTYRDGGGLGEDLSVEWAGQALRRLRPGGRLVLYSGSAIREGGRDVLREKLAELADQSRASLRYDEIDPDVFGEELREPAYRTVERIAVVACVITAP
ncbi:MAG TPA: methyltransferase, partial [Phenylobacterium sp.]